MKKCKFCGGTGNESDNKVTGAALSRMRVKMGIKQSSLASAMKISSAYLSQLESGKRRWTVPLISKYNEVCQVWDAMDSLGKN